MYISPPADSESENDSDRGWGVQIGFLLPIIGYLFLLVSYYETLFMPYSLFSSDNGHTLTYSLTERIRQPVQEPISYVLCLYPAHERTNKVAGLALSNIM